MKINKKRLKNIFEFKEESDDFISLLQEYDGEIKFEENSNESSEEKIQIQALNKACDEICKILKKEEIDLLAKDIKKIINDRIIDQNDYPNSENKNEKIKK